jgi:hypothetical protein
MHIFSSEAPSTTKQKASPRVSSFHGSARRPKPSWLSSLFYEHLFVLRRRYPEGVESASLRFTEAREDRNLHGFRLYFMNIFSSSDDDIPKASKARLFVSRKRAKTETFMAFVFIL